MISFSCGGLLWRHAFLQFQCHTYTDWVAQKWSRGFWESLLVTFVWLLFFFFFPLLSLISFMKQLQLNLHCGTLCFDILRININISPVFKNSWVLSFVLVCRQCISWLCRKKLSACNNRQKSFVQSSCWNQKVIAGCLSWPNARPVKRCRSIASRPSVWFFQHLSDRWGWLIWSQEPRSLHTNLSVLAQRKFTSLKEWQGWNNNYYLLPAWQRHHRITSRWPLYCSADWVNNCLFEGIVCCRAQIVVEIMRLSKVCLKSKDGSDCTNLAHCSQHGSQVHFQFVLLFLTVIQEYAFGERSLISASVAVKESASPHYPQPWNRTRMLISLWSIWNSSLQGQYAKQKTTWGVRVCVSARRKPLPEPTSQFEEWTGRWPAPRGNRPRSSKCNGWCVGPVQSTAWSHTADWIWVLTVFISTGHEEEPRGEISSAGESCSCTGSSLLDSPH